MSALIELEGAYETVSRDPQFARDLTALQTEYAGRETPLTFCPNASRELGCKIYLKREDLVHGGSHKLNNTLGQALLAKTDGQETADCRNRRRSARGCDSDCRGGAGAIPVEVYMGEVDTQRQALNVFRMELMGAKVDPGKIRDTDTQGCDQRSASRLGGKRAGHLLPDRLRSGSAPVSADRTGLPVSDRQGGP